MQDEADYLERIPARLDVVSPVAGVITTAHLKEKIGQFVHEGDLIGVVEEPAALEAEIPLAEQDVTRVQPGQAVALKRGAAVRDLRDPGGPRRPCRRPGGRAGDGDGVLPADGAGARSCVRG